MKITTLLVLSIILLTACSPTEQPAKPDRPISATITQTPEPINTPLPTIEKISLPFIPTPLAPPPSVIGTSMTYDRARGELVLFGGGDPPQCTECNTTWIWDGFTWIQRQPNKSPSGRLWAGFVYDQTHQNSVLFGSPSQIHPYINDTWIWDGQNWVEKHPSVSPPARGGQDNIYLVYDFARKVVVLFGGCAPNPNSNHIPVCFNDTWLWDGENWTQANPLNAPPPLAGIPSAMAYDGMNQNVVLYGLGTWIWDGTDWTEQHPTHSPIIPFYGVMQYDESNQRLVLVGQTLDHVTQTWVWDGKDWKQVETQLKLGFGSGLHLFFDTKHQALLLYVVSADKVGVTGFSMWMWKDNDWIKIY